MSLRYGDDLGRSRLVGTKKTLVMKPDVMAITEILRMTEINPMEKLHFNGHQSIVSKPRKKYKHRSGGVASNTKVGMQL